ncbi:MAG: MFS transporter [Thaumarchaeota archaeon]|nr:MFS transporter [Nitrososphaerota archaeon]
MKTVYVLFGITFVNFSSIAMIRLTIPLLLTHVNAPLAYIGAAMAAHSIAIALSSVPLGWASDRLGREKLFFIGAVLMILASILFIGLNDPFLMLGPLLLLGIGWGAFEPAIQALVGDIARPGEMGRSMGTFSAMLQAGSSFGPVLAGVLITVFGFQSPFVVSPILFALAVILVRLAFRQRMGGKPSVEKIAVTESFKAIVSSRFVLMGWVATIFSFTIIGGFEIFFPVYANHIGLEPWLIGLLFGVQTFIGMLARIPVGTILDKIRDKVYMMVAGLAVNATMVAIIPFFTQPLILLLIMAVMISSRAMTNIGGMTMVALGTASKERGLAVGLTTTFRHGGLTIGPSIFGVAASATGLATGFLALSVVALPGSALMIALGRYKAGLSKLRQRD